MKIGNARTGACVRGCLPSCALICSNFIGVVSAFLGNWSMALQALNSLASSETICRAQERLNLLAISWHRPIFKLHSLYLVRVKGNTISTGYMPKPFDKFILDSKVAKSCNEHVFFQVV